MGLVRSPTPRWAVGVLAVVVASALALLPARAEQAGTVRYEYDAAGRLVKVTAPSGDVAVYTYDAVGNLLSIARISSGAVTVTEFSPASGPVGTPVTLVGSGFSTTATENQVAFNGVQATVTTATATQLSTSVPVGATTGFITVSSPSGSAVSDAAFVVTTGAAPPSILSFTPTIGVVGTPVTITGASFDPTASSNQVRFNDRLTFPTAATPTQIETSVPAESTGGRIKVGTVHGTAVSEDDFYVVPSSYVVDDVLVTARTDPGSGLEVALTTAEKIGLILVDGVAGQRMSVVGQVSSGSFLCNWILRVLRMDGTTLGQASPGCSQTTIVEPVTLPAAGTYTILVDPFAGGTGTATITPHTVVDITTAVVPGGATVQAALTTPGQQARLPFTGAASQRVSVFAQITSGGFGCNFGLRILNSSQTVVGQASTGCSSSAFLDPVLLPAAGSYVVQVDPGGVNTGTAAVTLYNVVDVTDPITPGGAPLSVALTSPGQAARLPFSGAAGQRVSLKATVTSGNFGCNFALRVLNPDGSILGQGSNGCSSTGTMQPVTLPSAGTYTVLVDPGGTWTGTGTVTLYDVVDVTDPITINGDSVVINLTSIGQVARLPFTGTASESVTAAVAVTSGGFGCSWAVQILNPDQSVLSSTTSCNGSSKSLGPLVLPTAGTYTLVVDPAGASTGVGSVTLTATSPPPLAPPSERLPVSVGTSDTWRQR